MFYTYCNSNRARRTLKLIKNIYYYPLDDILCEVYDEFAFDIDIENMDIITVLNKKIQIALRISYMDLEIYLTYGIELFTNRYNDVVNKVKGSE